jgi:hypothetical protein
MKILFKVFIVVITLFIFNDANCQSGKVLKFKSTKAKLSGLNNLTKVWETKEFTIDNLIVLDLEKKAITVYQEDSTTTYDIISRKLEEHGGYRTFNFTCIDNEGAKCDIQIFDNLNGYYEISIFYETLHIIYMNIK